MIASVANLFIEINYFTKNLYYVEPFQFADLFTKTKAIYFKRRGYITFFIIS